MQFMAEEAIREYGPVPLLSPFALSGEKWVVPVAIFGSPVILSEKLISGNELIGALHQLEQVKQVTASAVTAVGIGGMNALSPILTAALAKLPVVDCDGMGRTFTELQMTTFHAFGVQASPFIMQNDRGHCYQIKRASNFEVEQVGRQKVTEMGGWAATATYPMTAQVLREVAVHRSISLAVRLGERVRAAGADIHQVFAALVHVLHNSLYGRPCKLMEGKVVNLQRNLTAGLLIGSLIIEGGGFDTGEQAEVFFKNEYLSVKRGKQTLATVPDLICILDARTGRSMAIEELEQNMQVWVISIPCPYMVRHPNMLEVVGPEAYGLEGTYVSTQEHYLFEQGEQERV